MRIALAAANMGKPVAGFPQLLARLDRIAFDNRGCDVLVLPEYWAMLCLDFAPDDLKPAEEVAWMAEMIKREDLLDKVEDIAKRYDMAILPGSWPVETHKGYVNRAHFINEDGVLAVQNKMALTNEEQDRLGWCLRPGDELEVFEFMGTKCAIAICHDTSYKEEFVAMKKADVKLVFMPSMCEFEGNDKTVDGHRWIFEHARKRSSEMNCAFACVGSVGAQAIGLRLEMNVGGAALYQGGVCQSEIGPLSKGRGASAFILKVDVDL